MRNLIEKIVIILLSVIDNNFVENLLNKVSQISSTSFIAINNYVNSVGEISNRIININIDMKKAKLRDLAKLENYTNEQLTKFALTIGIDYNTVLKAYNELLTSLRRNTSENFEDHTTQSKAQSEAYINLTPCVKFNVNTKEYYIFGQSISKEVLNPDDVIYKVVNSSDKTIAKRKLEKELKLTNVKLFKVTNLDSVKIMGEIIPA